MLSQSLIETDSKGEFESQRDLEDANQRSGSLRKSVQLSDKEKIKEVLKPAISDKKNFLKMFKDGIESKDKDSQDGDSSGLGTSTVKVL